MNQPQFLANRYQIIKHLGSGGFGDTFLAEDTHLPSKRICVIKQLRPMNNNPQIYQLVKDRFQREAAILEDLGNGHSQIPSLYAYFEEQGQFYLVQEYIEGKTLSKIIETEGKQSEAMVKNWVENLLPVLSFLQGNNIIHRDIKPDNIIIRQTDGMPILIDFGAVRETMGTAISPSGNYVSSIVIGTPGFMPPEQAIGRPVFSSDLYALGLTAIYLLTNKFPQELETDQITGEIIWKNQVLNITSNLANVLDKAIQHNTDQRFSTAQIMLDAMRIQIPVIEESKPLENNFPERNKIILPLVIGGGILIVGVIFLLVQLQGQIAELKNKKEPIITNQNTSETTNQNTSVSTSSTTSETINTPPPQKIPVQVSKVWVSQTGQTRLSNLDKICSGSKLITDVVTVFGYTNDNRNSVIGNINLDSLSTSVISTSGCQVGGIFTGNFDLANNRINCIGRVTISWLSNNRAKIKWNITNLGTSCPVLQSSWSIETYPVSN